MIRKAFTAILLVLGMALAVAGVALADGGKGVAVNTLTPKPGEEITVKGEVLGPNSEVEVRVIGNGVDVALGDVKADAEGDFTAKFTLPADLKPGTYQLKATGADSATTELRVVTGVGTAGMSEGAPMEETQARARPLSETAGLIALFAVVAVFGLFFARTARDQTAS